MTKKLVIEGMLNDAEMFWNAGEMILDRFNKGGSDYKTNQYAPQTVSVAAVNATLSIEIYFKALYNIVTQRYIFGHELSKLYNSLPIVVKKEIEILYKKDDPKRVKLDSYRAVIQDPSAGPYTHGDEPEFLDLALLLERHNKAFIRWRYPQEIHKDPVIHADFDNLNRLRHALKKTIISEGIMKGLTFNGNKHGNNIQPQSNISGN